MATTLTPILTAFWDHPESWTLKTYRDHGGYRALDKALGMEAADILTAVKDSSLRGRGGAGFPTGMKWSFMAPPDGGPRYLVVNADESEPGTCKDVPLMMANPHVLIEGVAISSYAIGCEHAFIYLRGEVVHVYRRLLRAVEEAYAAGLLGKDINGTGVNVDITVHAGAGAYICGEETALLDSLEGRRGQPRSKPPFPGAAGLYARPTSVNNVESIASVPGIILEGVDWFTGMGTEKSTGFGIFSLSGHVKNPGQFEAPLGITMRELIEMAGGMRDPDKELKFWTPGGSSTPLFTAEHLDVPLDFESVAAAGSMLGTRALQVFDETVCVVRAVDRWTDFYKHESCGKCTPCREGTWWLKQILGRLEHGEGERGGPRQAPRPLRQHPGPQLLRAGRWCDEPDHELDPVLPRRVRRPPDPRWLPVRPGRLDAVGQGRRHEGDRLRMTATPETQAPVELVTLTIDDVEVSVPKGTLIIRAAEQVGIDIPRFCDHPGLDPVGACRQCLVEVWMPGRPGPDGTPGEPTQMQGPPGRMKPQASCTMTVAPGMVVKTQYTSPGADKAQQGIMEFLLINHPLDCPVCDKGGECPLQNQAMSNGRGTSRFEDVKRTYPKPINISSQVLLDRERCVLCARCTRFSDQIAGDPFIALVERGALQQVGIYEEKPFESYFSGNTVQICPVGALTGAAYRFRSRPFDLVSTPSVCEHCASGCSQRTDHRRGTVLRRMAQADPAVNEEWNCDKGRWAFQYTQVGDRIEYPMVRGDDGELRVASWREALERAAAGLRAASGDRRARRRSRQQRGRLRVRQVRPHRPRHQRRRLPRAPALGGGGGLPRLDRRRPRARGRCRDVRRPRGRPERRARRVRARGRVPDRLPAPAQGLPPAQDPRLRGQPGGHPRPGQDGRHAHPHRTRHRARGAARPRQGLRLGRRGRRGRGPARRRRPPRRRAPRDGPRCAERRGRPRGVHRCPARLGPAAGR